MNAQLLLWLAFAVMVLGGLAIDLGFFQRKAHVVKAKEALAWTVVWILLAFVFCAGIYYFKGKGPALEYLAGYLIEKSLSVDNLFVFVIIFSYFAVPPEYESRILMWGILGALIMRAIFIAGGTTLMNNFTWMPYVFGAILIYTGFKLLVKREGEVELERNPVVRAFKRFFPVSPSYDGKRFFTRVNGKWAATPLFIVLLVVESSDVIFAVDSVPAIFAVTTDGFIVYTSNVFAILGLRSMYFLLARMVHLFRFLKFGLVLILWFVGAKLLLAHHYKIPTGLSLGVIGAILALSVTLSLWVKPAAPHAPAPPKSS